MSYTAVTKHDISIDKTLGQEREPSVRGWCCVGRCGEDEVVLRTLDTHVESNLQRYWVEWRTANLHRIEVWIDTLERLHILEKVVVVTHIDKHYLELVVILRQQVDE